jgi:Glycosyl hydrolases family 15
MNLTHSRAAWLVACCLSLPASATNLVTGNGFGFAVVSPETAVITKFYGHPYSFLRPDPKSQLAEGVETPDFLKSLEWRDRASRGVNVNYEQDSEIIGLRGHDGDGFVFMPFGLNQPALIVVWNALSATARSGGWTVAWNHPVRSARSLDVSGITVDLLAFDGIAESLVLIPLAPLRPAPAAEFLARSPAWALVALEDEKDLAPTVAALRAWQGGRTVDALVAREISELERWRVPPPASLIEEKERHLWRQSEIMLRMAQSREANRSDRHNNGLLVASLPDGVWFTPWVRDMAWAAMALVRMGHRTEARAALLAYFEARPTGKMRAETAGADYQVSVVRYFGNGSEEPFFTMEGSTNVEFDDWGEVLWVLGEYLDRYHDTSLLGSPTYRGSLYESARDYVVTPLLKNLESFGPGLIVAADTSIWEEREKDRKHFAFSTAMAILGLENFAAVAERAGDRKTGGEIRARIELLRKGFAAAFIREGRLHGTLEEGVKNDIDGALLPILHFGVVKDRALIEDVLARMEKLRVSSGGYRRVQSTYTDPAIFEFWYEREEFVFVDLALAEVERETGRRAQSGAMLARIVDKAAADHDILPEMYVALPCPLFPGNIGDPTGARPMVGYGAGAYILDALERSRKSER